MSHHSLKDIPEIDFIDVCSALTDIASKIQTKLAVFEHEGKVVIDLSSPFHWLGMNPDQANDLGRALIKYSNKRRKNQSLLLH